MNLKLPKIDSGTILIPNGIVFIYIYWTDWMYIVYVQLRQSKCVISTMTNCVSPMVFYSFNFYVINNVILIFHYHYVINTWFHWQNKETEEQEDSEPEETTKKSKHNDKKTNSKDNM